MKSRFADSGPASSFTCFDSTCFGFQAHLLPPAHLVWIGLQFCASCAALWFFVVGVSVRLWQIVRLGWRHPHAPGQGSMLSVV